MSSVSDALWHQLTDAEKDELLARHATRDPAAEQPLRAVPLAGIVSKEYPPQQFLIDGLLPAGQFVMVGGRGKIGKSSLVLQGVAAIDRGLPFLGKPTKRGRVLYLALEDGERRIHQRCHLLKWQPSDGVQIAFKIDNFDRGKGINHIRQAIAQDGFDLVVVDTLVATLSGSADENNNTEMAAICNQLADMAHETGAGILMVHHTSKVTTENPFDNLRGASAIRNAYDAGWLLRRKHGEREATLFVESRDYDTQDMTIKQGDNSILWEYVGDAAAGVAIAAGRVGVDLVKTHGEGLTANDLADLTGKTSHAIRSSMKTAASRALVEIRHEPQAGSNQWVDRYYLTADGKQ